MYTNSASVRVLQRMREAKGNPSYARIAAGVNGVPSKSTIERVFRGETLPTFENARVIVQYLEGNLQEYIDARNADGLGIEETDDEGPIPPSDFKTVATAADLNRLTAIYTNALHERDEIYAMHTQTRNDAYNRALDTLRAEHIENMKSLERKHESEIKGLTEAHVREVRSKDKWITLLAMLCILCVVAMIMMMVSAIHSPHFALFGSV